ncbi:hypothetical protein NE237_024360 [Protea cynaroides]|uniref:E2F/DP family winged-helix DNA-binding domain-containing protein n=1 Tax=Protea cynaroides TaxID=273540 RepID=A0A9Q0HFQ3_9MAGN|nr:hypothetical protein NE237_024360 [Protea cynaroides]
MSGFGEDSGRSSLQTQFKFQFNSQSQSQIQSSSPETVGSVKRHFPFSYPRPSSFAFNSEPQSIDQNLSPDPRLNLQMGGSSGGAEGGSMISKIPLFSTDLKEDNLEGQIGEGAICQGHSEAINGVPNTGGKRCSKSKVSKHRKSVSQYMGSNSDTPSNMLAPAGTCRYDNSLGLLTKKFIRLIQEAKDGTLDLNNTSDVLEVQKRRIYDITNVLEGTGLIEKTSKNNIRWKGLEISRPNEFDGQVTKLKAEVESLYDQECRLNDSIRKKQESLRALDEDENSRKLLFLTEDDIMSLPCFQNHTLIAIKAPQASSLEVPDPDEDDDYQHRQFRIIVRSTTGPIDLYLLSKHQGRCDDINGKRVMSIASSMGSSNLNSEDALLQKFQNERLSEAGHCQDNTKNTKIFNSSARENLSGIRKIIPADFSVNDDYWFQSDLELSITDLWANEDWAQVCEPQDKITMHQSTGLIKHHVPVGGICKQREIELCQYIEKT